MSLKQKADTRKLVRDIIEAYKGELDPEAFIDEAGTLLEKPKPEPKHTESFTFKQLEKMILPFGLYSSKTFDSIPLGYLDWLCGTMEDQLKLLQMYLKHSENQRVE